MPRPLAPSVRSSLSSLNFISLLASVRLLGGYDDKMCLNAGASSLSVPLPASGLIKWCAASSSAPCSPPHLRGSHHPVRPKNHRCLVSRDFTFSGKEPITNPGRRLFNTPSTPRPDRVATQPGLRGNNHLSSSPRALPPHRPLLWRLRAASAARRHVRRLVLVQPRCASPSTSQRLVWVEWSR